ncbi:hypothetical protein [Coleofasciculus sp. E1-EBD-02]|uniref:hypothetical protein n=1 Tax=Coleofasciculus sp. E1-EBD-02 TaxID=3068481 RepID=UPI0032FC488D
MDFLNFQEKAQLQQILSRSSLLQTADDRSNFLVFCGLEKSCGSIQLDKPLTKFLISLLVQLSQIYVTFNGSERRGLVVFLEYLIQLDYNLSTEDREFIQLAITKCQYWQQQLEQASSPFSQTQMTNYVDLTEAEVEETMKRREFLNLSTQTFIYSSLQTRPKFDNAIVPQLGQNWGNAIDGFNSSGTQLKRDKRAVNSDSGSILTSQRNLTLHYLDHYVLQMIGYERLKPKIQQAIRQECQAATRLAILFADQVFVPAVSYYQSSICRKVIDYYRDIFDTGIIRIIADAYSLEEFQDNRLREYEPGSIEFNLYQKILDISRLQPSIYSCTENTTIALHNEWNNTLLQDIDIAAIFAAKLPYELLPNDMTNRLIALPEKLHDQAFIVRNIYPKLFSENYISIANELLKIINELFFNWFTRKLKSGVVTDLVYLNQLSIKSHGVNLPYTSLKTELIVQHGELFKEIVNCKPYELLMLKKDAVWNEVLDNSIFLTI